MRQKARHPDDLNRQQLDTVSLDLKPMKFWLRKHPLLAFVLAACLLLLGYCSQCALREEWKYKRALLVATREAPVGGEYIHLYPDSTIEWGVFPASQEPVMGRYRIAGDTIHVTGAGILNRFPAGFLIISGKQLRIEGFNYFIIGKNEFQ
jgi:hypothetical protein